MATRPRPTEVQTREMAEAYSAGQTLQSIATATGFSVPTVSKYVKAAGVAVAGKGRRPGVRAASAPLPTVEASAGVETLAVEVEEQSDTFDF